MESVKLDAGRTFVVNKRCCVILCVTSLVKESHSSAVFMVDFTFRFSITVKAARELTDEVGQSQVSISVRNIALTLKYFG